MSDDTTPPPPENKVDLSDLRLMPSWVASFGKEDSRARAAESFSEERDGRGGRGDRRDGGGGAGRGGFGGGGERRAGGGSFTGQRREGGGGAGGPPSGPRRDGPGAGTGFGGPRREGGGFRGGQRDDQGPRFDDRPALPPGLKLFVEPEDKSVDALAQHVRGQGRAFSLFEAAKLVLAGADRHRVRIICEPERVAGLFSVPADGSLFETREEALRHLISDAAALATFYSCEEVEMEEPKGAFNSVGVCGLSGTLLGPASHHSYMTALKRLHNERYSNMSFEDYRRRVRTESDPELVAKWKEQQRKGTKWIYLKGEGAAPAPAAAIVAEAPTESEAPVEGSEATETTEAAEVAPAAVDTRLSFNSRAEMEAHFRRTHAEGAVAEVREAVISGAARREQLSPGLGRLVHRTVEDARKHLFELSQKMAQGLERRGLKLFKRRGGKMFVSRVKPKAIDEGVIFSTRITSIVEVVRKQPGILISKVAETLAPYAEEPVAEIAEPVVEPTAEVAAEVTAESPAATTGEATNEAAPRSKPQGKGRPEKKAPAPPRPLTDDQVAIIRDLRWLADEGYVIEYGDGAVFIGVQSDAPREKAAKPAGESKTGEVPETHAETPADEAASETHDEAAEESAAEAEEATPEAEEKDAEVATAPVAAAEV